MGDLLLFCVLLHRNIKITEMNHKTKSSILLIAFALISGVAGAQTNNIMEKNKMQRIADTVKNGYQKIEDGVVSGYNAIENGVVSGHTTIQNGVVDGFTRISDTFVKKFLMRDNETLEEAKARIAREEEELHRQAKGRASGSRQANK